jgi:hypothetical protein
MVTTGLETDDDVHDFPLTREGDHLHDFSRLASLLPILPIEVLGGVGLGTMKAGYWVSGSISSKAVELIAFCWLNERFS